MTTHNLPRQSTPFIGRATEIAEIMRLLDDPNCRLLTLVGPGGIGKTRLALQAADQHRDYFPDGVYFVPLAPLSSPATIVPAIAEVIGLRFSGTDDPQQQLLDDLRPKTLLLLMDNFEHLLDGAGLVADILDAAPGVKIIVTSREALNLQEEWVRHIGGMSFPNQRQTDGMEDYGAVQLFIECARRMRGDFVLAKEAAHVVRICQLVEGMPLAIELAAAWLKTLTCEQIADEIQGSIDFLETPLRNVPERHRSIRAVFDHSWKLLTDYEQAVFRKLSVFRGGFTREAGQAVAGVGLKTLSSLVNKSLLWRHPDTGRYDIHELLRQYAGEKLAEMGETKIIQITHSQYYADFMEKRWQYLRDSRQRAAMHDIELEIDNVRLAWRWTIDEHLNTVVVEQMLYAFGYFYDARCWFDLGEREMLAAVAVLGDVRYERLRGKVLTWLSHFSWIRGHLEQASTAVNESIGILRRLDARQDLPFALVKLADVASGIPGRERNFLKEKQILEEALAIARELGDRWEISNYLQWLGLSAIFNDNFEEAAHLCREGLALARETGSPVNIAQNLMVICWCALSSDDLSNAKPLFREYVQMADESDNLYHMMLARLVLALVTLRLGEYDEALPHLIDGLSRTTSTGIELTGAVNDIFVEITPLLMEKGEKTQALEYLHTALHNPYWKPDRRVEKRALDLIAGIEAELPDNVVQAVHERIQSLDIPAAIQRLIKQLQTIQNAPQSQAIAVGLESISQRELEILRLIAGGCSNQEIAAQTYLAISTVKWYINQIFTKLHVSNRTQAVAHARALDLLN